jgi:hypothetical protein
MSMHWNESEPGVARTMNKKKKTARWCRGKVGVEHVTELVVNHNYTQTRPCGWFPLYRRQAGVVRVYSWRWHCRHSLKCVNCGKYVVYFVPAEQCPLYTPRAEP